MGTLNKSATQINKSLDFTYDPTIFKLKSNTDTGMTQTITSANTYQDVAFSDIDFIVAGDLSYDGNIVTYNGTVPMDMTMNLSCSVASSEPNTIIHVAQSQVGVIDEGSESSCKVETNTAIQSLNTASFFTMQPGDTLNLEVKADKTGTVTIYHIQVVLKQIKVVE